MADKKSTLNEIPFEKATSEGKDEPIKPSYVSKDGFEKVPIRRGMYEIKMLLSDLSNKNVFICGGYVRFMASPDPSPTQASDVDIYCYDEEAYEACRLMFKEIGLEIRFENDMAITYKKPEAFDHRYFACPTPQLIKPVVEGAVVGAGDMETILENFDFTIIRCGLIEKDEMALVDADFMHDEENRIIRIKNIHCPISSTQRCMKYAKKGYWLPTFQTLRLFTDWDDRDDDYKLKLLEFLSKFEGEEGATQEDVDELEAMMRID